MAQGLGFRGLGLFFSRYTSRFVGLGFRGLGFRGLGFRGLGFRGLGFGVLGANPLAFLRSAPERGHIEMCRRREK